MDDPPVFFDPSPVAQHPFVAQRAGEDPPPFAVAHERQTDVAGGDVDEQRVRRDLAGDAASAQRDDDIAGANVQPRFGERRIQFAIPGVAAVDARDAVAARALVPNVVGPQEAAPVLGRNAKIAADLVRVRGPQLALHFPNQIGKFDPRTQPRQQRRVTRVDRVPVDARHPFVPKLLALQAPGFGVHLAPLAARFDQHADAAQIEVSAAPVELGRRFGFLFVFGQVGADVDHAQPFARCVDQGAAVGADPEIVDVAHQRRRALLGEIVRHERAAVLGLVAAPRMRLNAAHRELAENHAPLHAGDLLVVAFVDRKSEHALRQAGEIDRDRRRRVSPFPHRRLRRRLWRDESAPVWRRTDWGRRPAA